MPEFTLCSKVFLAQILIDEKKALERLKVPRCNIPKWPELAVHLVWERVKNDPNVMVYFPPERSDSKLPPRDYFWGILTAINPAFVESLVGEARQIRVQHRQGIVQRGNTLTKIGITKEWAHKLLDKPFVSRK